MKNLNAILGITAILMLPMCVHADEADINSINNKIDKAADKVEKAADKAADKLEKAADSTKETLSDATITANVKAKFASEKLLGDKDMEAMSISVETKEGVVHLTGTVDNEEQLKNAIDLAKSADGVKDVKSGIVVKAKK